MKLSITQNIFVSDITSADKPAYIEHLKEKQIYNQTLAIPYPYSETDANWWVNHVAELTQKQGRSTIWAIRNSDGNLIGTVGFHDFELGKSHRAELGYWLAKPYWGQGIMTETVKKISEYGFSELGLARITANVFHFNQGSAKVLEKAGFSLEGILSKHYKKDGKIFDGKLYAKIAQSDSKNIHFPRLETQRTILRLATLQDVPQILRYFDENSQHLAPTDPPKPEGFHTEAYWNRRILKAFEEFVSDRAVRFFIFERQNNQKVIGTVNLSQIFRGPFQACYLGYGIAKTSERKGLMTEALQETLHFAFSELKLHRIMANHLVENSGSAQLLQKLGFIVEGQAKNYLFINGAWRDHVLTSLTRPT